MKTPARCSVWIALVWLSSAVATADSPGDLVYESHVRPILKANCFHCHGEEEKVEGHLDVRLARLIAHGGDSGPAIVIGQPEESPLLQRVIAGEMPPGDKKLTTQQIDIIRRWVATGAKTARPEPEHPPVDDFTKEERAFWSFQPIQNPPVPLVQQANVVRSAIDQFLLAKLESQQLGFSDEADRVTLIRRLTFDLHGLPPTVESIERFTNDLSPDAYERLLDELLASPHFGERWGRHWLDVAGYADSDGYTETDPVRAYAYKYRDYVVGAFNADKPIDQFIVEQLAGDELLPLPYENLSADAADKLAATGFLRMAPDGTGAGGVDANIARNDVMAETIKIVSTSLLGLTVGCAQCHNHRYDPIAQTDYYRFRALFEPSYDWKNWRAPQSRLVSLWSADELKLAQAVDVEIKQQSDIRQTELDAIVQEVFEREVGKLPEEQRELARTARTTAADKRSPEQTQLLKDQPSLNVDRGSVYLYEHARVQKFNETWDKQIADIRARRPKEDYVPCLTEVPGQIPPTHLFSRGEFAQPKQVVEPGELLILNSVHSASVPHDDPQLPTSGRRLAYARQLTDGNHPLLGRVLVNRFWLHHFGKGIVASPGDFGFLGERPTHPELLDWLATRFTTDGWQSKRFHRLLLSSTVYRQQSVRRDEIDRVDPENRLLGRMPVRRLEAESIRDAILASSGVLSDKMCGEPSPVTVDDVGQVVVGIDTRDSAGRPTGKTVGLGEEEFRRSVYVQVRRTLPLGMLEPFDMPSLSPNCDLRPVSTVAPQALLMMNNDFVINESVRFAKRLQATVGTDTATQVTQAWWIAFGRAPTPNQLTASLTFIEDQRQQIPAPQQPSELPVAERALASFCQALFSSNSFVYID
ncbi:PSD1 and planctomycete cytochrome C domain-containing protein [Schlesneria paludicola]|uniref:PSD1 and planctomycete cytochrome C domain-containing protein n=1 Tax=Schlesneria paludicola TaxID=360056 RepID=UPI000299D902|nr:PSD1 and planctomycete cytochrome C domain-containing protein [Schlesneria paludicola]